MKVVERAIAIADHLLKRTSQRVLDLLLGFLEDDFLLGMTEVRRRAEQSCTPAIEVAICVFLEF